ncbi:membrane protein insertase YidC [symbiont of Argiope bruennichi]|uniref:membrane protein insertase YidC n=1 Tax=symbiont of Argiope bruennichi TaxID=2810479 RepID=UPI003DA347AD
MIQDLIKEKKNKEKRNFSSLSLKYLKIFLFVFLFVMSLYGCAQQFIDPRVKTYYFPGSGFEFYSNNTDVNNHLIFFNDKTGKFFEYFHIQVSSWWQTLDYGPFYFIFIYPFAYFCSHFLPLLNNSGSAIVLTIFLVVVFIRTATLFVTIPQFKQQLLMSKVQIKTSEIKGKYEGKKDKFSKQKQQMEIMALYKKYNLKPWTLFASTFVTLPFFYAMYRVFCSTYAIKNGTWGPFSMQDIPLYSIFHGHYWYILVVLIMVPVQICSFKLPQWLTSKRSQIKQLDSAAKKKYKTSQIINYVVMGSFTFISLIVPFSLTIYWFFGGLFTIIQNLLLHYYLYEKQKIKKRKLKLA